MARTAWRWLTTLPESVEVRGSLAKPRAPFHSWRWVLGIFVLAASSTTACSPAESSSSRVGARGGSDGSGGSGGSTTGGEGGLAGSGSGGIGTTRPEGGIGGSSNPPGGGVADPTTCAEAAQGKTYVGCDFWPTVIPNNVWNIFDFAVVVANAGTEPADVTVTLGNQQIATDQVPPNGLKKIFLPWVPALKGPEATCQGQSQPFTSSVVARGGAYHLVTSRPVTVYQFNALEYSGAGGPPGKDWSKCPGGNPCQVIPGFPPLPPVGCFSYSNDASLLIPSTALTGNYSVAGVRGWAKADQGGYFAVTGTQDATHVDVRISSTGQVQPAGSVLAGAGANQIIGFDLDASDVVLLMGSASSDLSGSVVSANKPVQVLAGIPCTQMPEGQQACDHVEESVFPAETLGQHYFVTVPTSPRGQPIGHVVRIYGTFDATTLSYPSGGAPGSAPPTINAGQVIDLGNVSQNFEIQGDKAFSVASFQLGAQLVDPGNTGINQQGDPSMSLATAVEQYRLKYVFLAPDDYVTNYVDVIMPSGAAVVVDGTPVAAPTAIGSSKHGVSRVKLGPGAGGAHVLVSDKPVGIQVLGYGAYTSYQYPGGLNLKLIAPPPPPIIK
jgi:IgGFc binding protein